MTTLKVMNPVAQSVETREKPAPRVPDLTGKRVGLYWNMKAGGDIALRHVGELIKRRYLGASYELYSGDVGAVLYHVTKKEADRIASRCDVIIGSTSD
jgi:hypothetical protein